jgi:hypothetical protein
VIFTLIKKGEEGVKEHEDEEGSEHDKDEEGSEDDEEGSDYYLFTMKAHATIGDIKELHYIF